MSVFLLVSQFIVISGNLRDNAVDETNSSNPFGSQSKSGTEKGIVSTESPTIITAQSSTNSKSPAFQCTPEDAAAMTKEIDALFAFCERAVVHNFYKCTSDQCQHLTSQEQSRLKPCRDRFVHN